VGPFDDGLLAQPEEIYMVQSKNLVAVLSFVGLLTTSGIANADGKFYVEAGASYTQPSDVNAEFTSENLNAVWDLDNVIGAKFQIGGDFGQFRTDLKVRAFKNGNVDAISNGVTAIANDRTILGIATLNGYWDITDIKAGDNASITPFVGIGGGYAAGFMEADGTLGGVVRTDHRNDRGRALVGTVGALFSVNEYFGLTAEYEYIDTSVGSIDGHAASLGLRVTF